MPTYDVLPHHGVKDQGEDPGKTQAFAGRGKVILVLIPLQQEQEHKTVCDCVQTRKLLYVRNKRE